MGSSESEEGEEIEGRCIAQAKKGKLLRRGKTTLAAMLV